MNIQLSRHPPVTSNKLSYLPGYLTPQTGNSKMQVNGLDCFKYLPTSSYFMTSQHDFHSDDYHKMMLDVFHEHLRQARQTFNLSIVAVAASLGISVIGAGLLVSGKAPEGSVTTATGLISTTLCSQIAKESGKKLEELREDLKALRSSSDT